MNISWKWLNELIQIDDIDPTDLANQLTLAGFEVEELQDTTDNDIIFNIDTTANRPDTNCLIGIAREISALLKRPIHRYNNQHNQIIDYKLLKNNNTISYYSDYLYTYIQKINVNDSPFWLKKKLACYNIKSINSIQDILNFINIKWGYKFHALDITDIPKNTSSNINLLITEKNNQGVFAKCETHDHNIDFSIFTENPQYTINKQTKTIIIQYALFNRKSVRCIIDNLNITNEQVVHNIQGIQRCDLLEAYFESLVLIKNICGGKSDKTQYFTKPQAIYEKISITTNNIYQILGNNNTICSSKLSDHQIINILSSLNCITYHNNNNFIIDIPHYRVFDLMRPIDIIEEIGRIHGYNKFLTQIPTNDKTGLKKVEKIRLEKVRHILQSIGLYETLHYSLIKNENHNLSIFNPLTEDFNGLRSNLIPSLLNTIAYNIKQNNPCFEIFEIGKVFKENKNFYLEANHLAGIIGGTKHMRNIWEHKPNNITWFQAKGNFEEIFEKLQLSMICKKISSTNKKKEYILKYYHPTVITEVNINNKYAGIFGQINPSIAKYLGISNNLYLFEINTKHLIQKHYQKSFIFQRYSKYPQVKRDLTITISPKIELQELLQKIKDKTNKLIESVDLFDIYNNNTEHRNLNLRFQYRSDIETLTNHQVDQIHSQVQELIQEQIKKLG